MCLLAGTLRIELRPSDLESLALTVTLYPEVSKALLTKGKVKIIYKMEPKIRSFAVRAFLTFYIYYIIKIIKSQNIYGANSGI